MGGVATPYLMYVFVAYMWATLPSFTFTLSVILTMWVMLEVLTAVLLSVHSFWELEVFWNCVIPEDEGSTFLRNVVKDYHQRHVTSYNTWVLSLTELRRMDTTEIFRSTKFYRPLFDLIMAQGTWQACRPPTGHGIFHFRMLIVPWAQLRTCHTHLPFFFVFVYNS